MRNWHQNIVNFLNDICDMCSRLRCELLWLTTVGHLLDCADASTAAVIVLQVGKV
jgi:hypothetical protein